MNESKLNFRPIFQTELSFDEERFIDKLLQINNDIAEDCLDKINKSKTLKTLRVAIRKEYSCTVIFHGNYAKFYNKLLSVFKKMKEKGDLEFISELSQMQTHVYKKNLTLNKTKKAYLEKHDKIVIKVNPNIKFIEDCYRVGFEDAYQARLNLTSQNSVV